MLPDSPIDRASHVPYYVQVKSALMDSIADGGWPTGTQLPGEPELCRIFGVSRTVIRQALKELEFEGLITREKGKGTFVSEPRIDQGLVQELTGFYQDMVKRGRTPITQVLAQELVAADAEVAARLHIDQGSPVVKIHRLRGVEQEFIILDTTYLPYAICPQVLEADFSIQSLYAFLEDELGLVIDRGHRTLGAVLASDYEASLLKINPGDPLILLDSVAYLADGRPIEYFHAVHRGGRARFEVDLIRVRRR